MEIDLELDEHEDAALIVFLDSMTEWERSQWIKRALLFGLGLDPDA